MKKPSGNRVNLAIMIIVIVVLALGLAAILGYGKARKQMEQMQQAQQEAKEVSVTPTQTVTPEPTEDPSDPAVQKKNLIAAIEKAVEDNNVKTMTADLRYADRSERMRKKMWQRFFCT